MGSVCFYEPSEELQERYVLAAERIREKLLSVASGELTKAEISGYTNSMDIYMTGPVI